MPVTDFDRVVALHAAIPEALEELALDKRWTLQGLGALSLLEARLATLTGEATWRRLSRDSLDQAFDLLSAAPRFSIGLHTGIAGIGWAARLVNRQLDGDAFDVSDVDDMVLDYLSSPASWDGNYDLMGGATGCAVHALAHPDRPRRDAMLDAYVRLLSSRAEPDVHGTWWKTPAPVLPDWQRASHPDGYVNLGLAHGIPGVVAMLSRMAMAGFDSPDATGLLEGAVAACLSELRFDPMANREVIGYVQGDGVTGRCAWCYGEPGVAVALSAAGKAVADTRLQEKARRLFDASVARSDQATRALHDIGFCHGWAGLHVLSGYLAPQVPVEGLSSSAIRASFIEEVREVCDASLAEGQLPMFGPADPTERFRDPTFVGGALGVAHVLLDAAIPDRRDLDLPWADCVLM